MRNYVLGNEWKTLEEQETPSYNAIVGANDSEDEEEVERADKFEEAYNFRFEEPGPEEPYFFRGFFSGFFFLSVERLSI